uniref:receptor protein-tyrosine kinase n=1 Tax=Bursaphelenchus xylophilus TaxID=6326 RepID=A0A1I7S422_BURXY
MLECFEFRKDMLHEISVMKILDNHPNIISLAACVSDLINPIIATEYCDHGDLLHMLREHPRHYMSCKPCEKTETCLSLSDIYRIGAQIADGMSYIAQNRFVHRDLAARNVLMAGNNVPKIGDFGLCISYSTKPSPRDAIKLPIRSLSIESLKDYIFCERTDVWAYGVLFFEILTGGEKPYSEIDNTKLLQYLESGERLKLPEDAPKELRDLIYECWMTDSSDRPSFRVIRGEMEGLLEHSLKSVG